MNLKAILTTSLLILPVAVQAESGFYVGGGIGGSRLEQGVGTTVQNITNPPSPFLQPPFSETDQNVVDIPVEELKGTDVAVRAFAGYRFGTWVALEGGFFDMGDAKDSYPFVIPEINQGGAFVRGDSDREINALNEINGFIYSVVGFLPITDRIELIGKIGAVQWDSEQIIRDQVAQVIPVEQPTVPATRVPGGEQGLTDAPNDQPIRRVRESGTDLALGFGALFNVSEHIALRAEFDWLDIDQEKEVLLDNAGTTGPVADMDVAWIMTLSAIWQF